MRKSLIGLLLLLAVPAGASPGMDLYAKTYRRLAQLKTLDRIDPASRSYCKAWAWMDFAKELLHSNAFDSNAVLAISEAEKIASDLESPTPYLRRGRVLDNRADIFYDYTIDHIELWDSAEHFQGSTFFCSPCFQGRLEVAVVRYGYLVKNGHLDEEGREEQIDKVYALRDQMNRPTLPCSIAVAPLENETKTVVVESAPPPPPAKISESTRLENHYSGMKVYFSLSGTKGKNVLNKLTYQNYRKNLSEDSRIKKLLSENRIERVMIRGYTDAKKATEAQQKLSLERAESIKSDLQEIFPKVSLQTGILIPAPVCTATAKECQQMQNGVQIDIFTREE